MKMGQQYFESINIHTRGKRGLFIKNSLELRTGKSKKIYYIYNILMCIDIFLLYPIIMCLLVCRHNSVENFEFEFVKSKRDV